MNQPTSSLKILVVDDQHVFREINSLHIKQFLEDKLDFEIMTAKGPEESLKIITENNINIVFTDLQINGDQNCGFNLTQKIKTQNPNTRVFIISNTIASFITPKALDAGAEDCFQLPLEQSHLQSVFSRYIEF